jgi:sulfur carrier protein
MNIQCNEKPVEIVTENLAAALLELGYESMHVATAINGEFVPRSMRALTVLKSGDHLDVVAPMQGG